MVSELNTGYSEMKARLEETCKTLDGLPVVKFQELQVAIGNMPDRVRSMLQIQLSPIQQSQRRVEKNLEQLRNDLNVAFDGIVTITETQWTTAQSLEATIIQEGRETRRALSELIEMMFALLSERMEEEQKTPEKLFALRLPRNPNFTGRDDILERLHEELTTHHTAGLTQAITGTGGIGKTQTANEYCYRHKDAYRYVLWVNATSEATLDADYRELADKLALPARASQEMEVVRDKVREWLEKAESLLLVFDNADAPNLLKPYRPVGGSAHILLTSRVQNLRSLHVTQPLVLDVMTPEEAVAFFIRSGALDGDDTEARGAATDLAEELGGLPLALEQACAYLLDTGVSFGTYLQSFRRDRLKHLEKYPPQMGDYAKTVAVTWNITLERLQQESESAVELLRHGAFLAPDRIPLDIFRRGATELGEPIASSLADVAEQPELLNELLAPCFRYSLLEHEQASDTIRMHRLLQEVVRAGMSKDVKRGYAERLIAALMESWPGGDFVFWPYLDQLLPHQLRLAKTRRELDIETEAAGAFLNQIGYHLYSRAQYTLAEPLYLEALKIRRNALPEGHPDIAQSLNNLAALYESQGRYKEAEPLYLEALKIWERALPPTHPNLIVIHGNMAALYDAMGELEKAREHFGKAEAIRAARGTA